MNKLVQSRGAEIKIHKERCCFINMRLAKEQKAEGVGKNKEIESPMSPAGNPSPAIPTKESQQIWSAREIVSLFFTDEAMRGIGNKQLLNKTFIPLLELQKIKKEILDVRHCAYHQINCHCKFKNCMPYVFVDRVDDAFSKLLERLK